jgi:hypothetical protein
MDYERRLLPHPYLAELEPTEIDPELERLMQMPAGPCSIGTPDE